MSEKHYVGLFAIDDTSLLLFVTLAIWGVPPVCPVLMYIEESCSRSCLHLEIVDLVHVNPFCAPL